MNKIQLRAFENGKPLLSTIARAWTDFLNGSWIKHAPSLPGKYLIANKMGRVTGEVFVFFDAESGGLAVRIRDGALCSIKELDDLHAYWWWSKPMPLVMPVAVPVEVRNPVREKPKPTASGPRNRPYVDWDWVERRRALAAQVGLHKMPRGWPGTLNI